MDGPNGLGPAVPLGRVVELVLGTGRVGHGTEAYAVR